MMTFFNLHGASNGVYKKAVQYLQEFLLLLEEVVSLCS